jgi:hypothetical protein
MTCESKRIAPFRRAQHMAHVAVLILSVIELLRGLVSAPLLLAAFGYLAYMVVDCIAFIGDRYLAEKLGYKCRDCGQRYSADGMKPASFDQIDKPMREP